MARLIAASPAAGRDRAQLLLVGAFTLAVLVVALAVVLNGAAQTEALATGGTDARDGHEAVRFQRDVHRGVGGLVDPVNRRNDSSLSDLQTALDASVREWDDLVARGSVVESLGTSVELTDTNPGRRIAQPAPRNFTDANGNVTWTPASSVNRTRGFEMNVSRADLSSTCGSCFEIVADDGTDEWNATIRKDAGAIEVTVDGSAISGTTCTVTAESAVVDLSRGTVTAGDDTCSFPAFATGIDPLYDVTYRNASAVNGTYELVVDASVADDARYADDGGSPSVSPAIYSAEVSLAYRTPRLTYTRTDFWIVPGENDV